MEPGGVVEGPSGRVVGRDHDPKFVVASVASGDGLDERRRATLPAGRGRDDELREIHRARVGICRPRNGERVADDPIRVRLGDEHFPRHGAGVERRIEEPWRSVVEHLLECADGRCVSRRGRSHRHSRVARTPHATAPASVARKFTP